MKSANLMQTSIRKYLVLCHRWAGLLAAPFLIITGLTGAVISWDHELDDWLNPHLRNVHSQGDLMPTLALAQLVENRYPQIQIASIPLNSPSDESLVLFAMPKQNPATGKLYAPGFNQIFLDPVSGEELGKRQWGAVWPINSENFVSFLYKLHFSLHLPEMFGTDRWGIWLLGGIAIIWLIDCFFGFYLTLPPKYKYQKKASALAPNHRTEKRQHFWKNWKKAWLLRLNAGNFKLNFDIHRAFGLWTWLLIFIIAFTAFSLNLRREIFIPVLSAVTTVSKGALDKKARTPLNAPIAPQLSYAQILPLALAEAKLKGWQKPAGRMGYFMNLGVYSVEFFTPDADHGDAGGGHNRLFFDANSGQMLGQKIPWAGTAGDIFAEAQFPMHSGRILGLPGRILISAMGVIVALLSMTGIYIWWRKRAARNAEQGIKIKN
jgi:uncharacterized iron-regulated membrane protein